ncbi:porin family protein, partial [Mesorhizobium sp. M2A.F.Ca.ET.037.01.1.1]
HYEEGPTADSSSHTKAGWTLGAGVEYAFAQNWTTRVEYRYTDSGSSPTIQRLIARGFTRLT